MAFNAAATTKKLVSSGKILDLFPVEEQQEMIDPKWVTLGLDYLYWFGYLGYWCVKDLTIDDIVGGVKEFQRWFGIKTAPKETGKFGRRTRRAMSYDRCGCPDIVDKENHRHRKYVRMQEVSKAQQARWRKTGLKYYIKSYVHSHDVAKSAQEAIIAAAWASWCAVTPLSVTRSKVAKGADLIIDTGRGPGSDFDGPAGTLAWAYLPEGDDNQLLMRFDLEEKWMVDKRNNGIVMLNVACHEFGHMLGLDHSRKPRALMAPFYNESIGTPQKVDDIPKVQKLYGAPKRKVQAVSTCIPDHLVVFSGGKKVTYVRED